MTNQLSDPINTFVTGPLEIFVFLHYKDTYINPLTNTKQYSLSFMFEIAYEAFELDMVLIDL